MLQRVLGHIVRVPFSLLSEVAQTAHLEQVKHRDAVVLKGLLLVKC